MAEGEKDCNRLWSLGLPATCNVGGAGKWTTGDTGQLIEVGVTDVVICPTTTPPDSNTPAHVETTCRAAGLSVRVVALPGLPPKGDVSHWLDAGHTKDDLLALVEAQPDTPDDPPPEADPGGPEPTPTLPPATLADVDAVYRGWLGETVRPRRPACGARRRCRRTVCR